MAPILTRLDLRGVSGDIRGLLPAPDHSWRGDGRREAVREILDEVRGRGDAALRDLTERFDGARIDDFAVPAGDIKAALEAVPAALRSALETAAANIDAYHRTQLHSDGVYRDRGLEVRDARLPVGRAGCYAPGGRAPLASSVLMTAVPARIAGVPEVVLCSPPGRDGRVADAVLAAAAVAGVDEVYAVGGAQAIAAMAYGTESIQPVDVIVGPGNFYVATAQRLIAEEGAAGVPAAFAGPSEVVVVADDTTPADYAAIDLVVQAEHGPDGLAWLISWSEPAVNQITEALERFVQDSPRESDVRATLGRGGFAVLTEGPEQAMAVANAVAPEHLELMTGDPGRLLPLVRNAGAVFVGRWAPASVGDYVAGPNHVLPTARSARYAGALRIDDFCKHIHFVDLDKDTLAALAPHVEALAAAEGLHAHAQSVRLREYGPPGKVS